MRIILRSLAILALLAEASHAKPLTYELPQNNCTSCHSVDYIDTQPRRRGKEFWEAEVKKMIKSYHAPISDADAKTIADYLATTY